jgi:hypothetical protein
MFDDLHLVPQARVGRSSVGLALPVLVVWFGPYLLCLCEHKLEKSITRQDYLDMNKTVLIHQSRTWRCIRRESSSKFEV